VSSLILDSSRITANVENGNIEQTVYDKKSVWKIKESPIDTRLKKEGFTLDFPIKILGNTLTIERKLLETGVFYSIKCDGEELLIRKTVDGKVQIYEVVE
jgi:hypothetical protein